MLGAENPEKQTGRINSSWVLQSFAFYIPGSIYLCCQRIAVFPLRFKQRADEGDPGLKLWLMLSYLCSVAGSTRGYEVLGGIVAPATEKKRGEEDVDLTRPQTGVP